MTRFGTEKKTGCIQKRFQKILELNDANEEMCDQCSLIPELITLMSLFWWILMSQFFLVNEKQSTVQSKYQTSDSYEPFLFLNRKNPSQYTWIPKWSTLLNRFLAEFKSRHISERMILMIIFLFFKQVKNIPTDSKTDDSHEPFL